MKESAADKAFQNMLEAFGIDHRLKERVQNDDFSKTKAQFENFLSLKLASCCVPGPMPLLTCQGFFEDSHYDIQRDPSETWGQLLCIEEV
jgi:hypothetical protein